MEKIGWGAGGETAVKLRQLRLRAGRRSRGEERVQTSRTGVWAWWVRPLQWSHGGGSSDRTMGWRGEPAETALRAIRLRR